MRLIDRLAEKRALSDLLDRVRVGMSGALVLRGEPGVGKSALLAYAVEHAGDLQVLRTTAVESERALGFAGLHQLLSPLLPAAHRLPDPQQRALGVAFGLVSGSPADPFLVGLAVLTLLSDAAEEKPVLCVIDDAQWLDDESAEILSFVARRLLADRVGMLFALRETTQPEPRLQALPSLPVLGLPEQDARDLLATAIGAPLDPAVVERLVAETAGNPLALVDVARELTAGQLDGRAPLPEPLPLGHRLELLFVRRVRELPAQTQMLLLLAATDPPGPGERLWRAAAALGIPESAAMPAEAAGLGVFWPEVAFAHPLVRSAVYQARPRSSDGRATVPSPQPAIPSGTPTPGPGTWPQRQQVPTTRSPRSSRRRRNGPGAGAGTPPRPRCWSAPPCSPAARSSRPSGGWPRPRRTAWPGRSAGPTPC